MTEIRKRILTVILLAPVVFFSVFKWSFLFFIIILSSSILIAFELMQMARTKKIPVYPYITYSSIFFILLYFYFIYPENISFFSSFFWIFDIFNFEYNFIIILLFISIFLILTIRTFSKSLFLTLESVSMHIFIVIYAGFFLAYLFWIREMDSFLLLYLLVVTWTTDSAAYIVGRKFAGTRLNLQVSPNKTLAGFISSIIFALVFAFLLREISIFFNINSYSRFSIFSFFVITLFLSCFSILGDLAESAIKRSFNIKDSQSYIPGHGGMMDVLDSLIYTAPIFYFILKFYN